MNTNEYKNYIEFYYNDEGNFTAEIHKQGKYRVVSNPYNVEKLIKICEKNGYKINQEGYIDRRISKISHEYEKYAERRKRIVKNLRVIGNILTNMKLNKKENALGKKLVAVALTGLLLATPMIITSANTKDQVEEPITYQQEQVLENSFLNLSEAVYQMNYDSPEMFSHEHEIMETTQEDQFHFSYEDRTSEENVSNAKRYEDLFEKYANRYGLDKDLLIALAAQESSGNHYENIDNGPAEGIMQIEKSVHIGSTVSAYNFETGEIDQITVTEENLKDLETNIQIGSMILRDCIENNNYNIPLSLQTYNFGYGNMDKVLAICSETENVDRNEITSDPTNNSWLQYRSNLTIGDPEYVEHVFSFLENNTELTVQKRNGDLVTISIANDYQKENSPRLN